MKKKFIKDSAKSYHRANQEPPWCTMIGLYLHKELRHKSVIQRFNHYGICPSYDRIIKIEDELTSAVCEQYEQEGVVIPCQLQKGRFTVAAVDNIDYNPSSTTAKSSFHGTSISMFQLGSEVEQTREKIKIPSSGNMTDLPESYSIVPCIEAQPSGMRAALRHHSFHVNPDIVGEEIKREYEWLNDTSKVLNLTLKKETESQN